MAAKKKIRYRVRRQEERIKQCRQRKCNVTLWRIGVMNVGIEKELRIVSLLSVVSQSTIQSNITRMNVVIKCKSEFHVHCCTATKVSYCSQYKHTFGTIYFCPILTTLWFSGQILKHQISRKSTRWDPS